MIYLYKTTHRLVVGGTFMAHEMTLKLTDQEYETLVAEAAKNGKKPEALLYDMIQRLRPSPQVKHPLTADEFEEKLERERLGRVFSGGKPMSEMVIEDRGPY